MLTTPLQEHQDGDKGGFQMVEITSAEDVAVYCIVCHLQEDKTGQMMMSALGELLKSLFCRAPQLKYGKLKALVEAHPDKLRYSKKTQNVWLCKDYLYSSLPVSDDEVQSLLPACTMIQESIDCRMFALNRQRI